MGIKKAEIISAVNLQTYLLNKNIPGMLRIYQSELLIIYYHENQALPDQLKFFWH